MRGLQDARVNFRGYVAAVCLPLLSVPCSFAASLSLEGTLTQGGLVQGRTQPGARVELDGRSVRVSSNGVFLLGFARDASPQSRLSLHLPDGTQATRVLTIAKREFQIQRIDGLPSEMVTPKEADLERIHGEIALIRKVRSRDDARTDFLSGFIWPVVGRITGVYGSQRILNGQPRQPHYGVDVAGAVGTPVLAPADGLVTLAHPDMYFTGGTLVVDHGHGLSSSFMHLSRILVNEGARVRQGEPIAEVGATGRVTGPHLHWGLNLFHRPLDPQVLMQSPLARNVSPPAADEAEPVVRAADPASTGPRR